MLVIIHGWSDSPASFNNLGKMLIADGIVKNVTHIRLGDYISLDDDITLDDLASALDKAWSKEKLSRQARSVDVVVHSTGGLIIRH